MDHPTVSGDNADDLKGLLVRTKALEFALMAALGALFDLHPDIAEKARERAHEVLHEVSRDGLHNDEVRQARRLIDLWRQ